MTERGRLRALEVIRHHRLIELFLHDSLGYSWDEVHAEAEKLEHAISETFEDRIAQKLGDPEIDPHGHPIPRKDGTIPERNEIPLLDVAVGTETKVSRVSDNDAEILRYLFGRWAYLRTTRDRRPRGRRVPHLMPSNRVDRRRPRRPGSG